MGLLCVTSADAMASTDLGRRASQGFAMFWGVRLLIQLFGYSPELWRGKRFETAARVMPWRIAPA